MITIYLKDVSNRFGLRPRFSMSLRGALWGPQLRSVAVSLRSTTPPTLTQL